MKKPYIVGLTGPTGAGKSTAAAEFQKAGFFHIDADKSARIVTLPESPALPILAEKFGHDIIKENGELNRSLLAKRAFASSENTEELNRLSFPFIMEQINGQIAVAAKKYAYILLDAPTLFESGCDRICDSTVGVLCDREVRIRRIIARDTLPLEDAKLRIRAGRPDSFYLERCRHILYNTGDLNAFLRHIEETLQKILTESRIT